MGGAVEFRNAGDKYYICYEGGATVEVDSLDEVDVFIKEISAGLFE